MNPTGLQKKDFSPFYSRTNREKLSQFLLDWLSSARSEHAKRQLIPLGSERNNTSRFVFFFLFYKQGLKLSIGAPS